MNKTYKVVYSKARQKFVVANEAAHACADRPHSSRFVSVSTLMAALGMVILSASAPAQAAVFQGAVGADGKITIDLGVDINGDNTPDSIEISGIGLSVVEGTFPKYTHDGLEGVKYISLKSFAASSNLGGGAIAIGDHAEASGDYSNAVGSHATASDHYAAAIGYEATASHSGAYALGWGATASKPDAYAIGYYATASGNHAYALGWGATASSNDTYAFGYRATASGLNATAIGIVAEASGGSSIAIGGQAKASADTAAAIGYAAEASGNSSIAIGVRANASKNKNYATAIGYYAKASEYSATAIGYQAEASKNYTNALGYKAKASGDSANAIGDSAEASGDSANAIGHSAKAFGDYATAIGWAEASGDAANAIGRSAEASGDSANAIGRHAIASGSYANVIGYFAEASKDHANAIGYYAKASGLQAIAIGYRSEASASYAIALGADAVADEENTVSVGRAAKPATLIYPAIPETRRRIIHVAEGTNGTDAATVSQTSTLDSSSGFLSINGDSTNTNGSKKYLLGLKLSDSIDSETEGLVTNKTVKAALEGLGFESGNDLTNYAKTDASNVSANAAAWATALGTGTIASGSNLLITGSKIYDELHLSEDGNYVLMSQTTGQNILALDTQLKALADSIGAGAGTTSPAGDLKHTTLVDSDHIKVTEGENEAGGKQYDISISETADFTAKQTTWKDGTSISTANSSGFFSGGASVENADAYVSKGVVSAGKDEATRIVLDGNTGKATFGKTVTIDGSTGRISGVAAGDVSEDSTDAVNGAQLYAAQQGIAQNAQGLENLGRQVNKMDRKIDRTGALAAALAALHPQAYDENHPVTGAVGIGHYKGKQALAVGMFVRPVENFMVSLGASAGSDDYMLNAGASFRFGGASLQRSPVQMASKISEQEVTIRDLAAQNQVQKTMLESQKGRLDAQKVQLDAQASEIQKLKAMMAEIQAKLAK